MSRRGFASMDPARVRELARRGAASAIARGVLRKWTTAEARDVARKGGETTDQRHGQAHFKAAGRKGGLASAAKRAALKAAAAIALLWAAPSTWTR
mgnify:FL=1